MILRHLATVASLLLLASPARAQEPYLTAANTECAALEALVVFGLIDGGEGGDTSELTTAVEVGDPVDCELRLHDYGYGDGLLTDACYDAMEAIAFYGPPEAEADPAALLYDILTGEAPESCQAVVDAHQS